ncbi:efflux RND transporter periplasmic adaptor subunit [Rhodoblastus sp.]|uniref:efflux RND transporter periplasmic adaptor subunit n=1 Tax=Rhodoblastus sp. TaxID=1962975 RepID=UPI003F950C2E
MLSSLIRALAFFLAALAGGFVVLWLGGHPQQNQPPIPPAAAGMFFSPQAPVVEVTQMPTAARFKLGGYVEARNFVRLTAQGPGRVTFVAGQEGERISAGNTVVALDDDALRVEYRSAWAALSGDMAAQQNAQTQLYHSLYGARQSPMGGPGYDAYERLFTPFYNMMQPFMGGGAPMQSQAQQQHSFPAMNNARADYERQQAGLVASQARIDALDQQLRNRRSVAPYAAVLMTRHVRVGDVVQPGQPLVDLADPDQLDLRVEVPANLAVNMKIGDQLPVSLSDANVWAVVSQIFPAANTLQHTVTVKAALPPAAPAAPGMYGLAWVAQPGGGGQSETAPFLPNGAIAYRGSLPVAFVVNGAGAVEMRILRLGEVSGDKTAVLSGLQPGEHVVAHPEPDLKSGDSVFGQRR